MQTVRNNKVNTSLEQSVVLGALDVIVIEWWWLLSFVLNMHSVVHSIVLKSVSWLHVLNRKNIINAFECNFLKIAKIATIAIEIQSKITNPVHFKIAKKRKIGSLDLTLKHNMPQCFFKILNSNLDTKRKCHKFVHL